MNLRTKTICNETIKKALLVQTHNNYLRIVISMRDAQIVELKTENSRLNDLYIELKDELDDLESQEHAEELQLIFDGFGACSETLPEPDNKCCIIL